MLVIFSVKKIIYQPDPCWNHVRAEVLTPYDRVTHSLPGIASSDLNHMFLSLSNFSFIG